MPLYSHSRLSSFESCPRQFWYRYIGKPDIEKVATVEAFLGKRVHETLEELYKLKLGGRLISESETLAWYEAAWDNAWDDSVRVVSRRFTASDYRQVGRESLAAYYRRYQPFDTPRTLCLESRVVLDLDPAGQYRMQGYIDRISRRDDGTYEIRDYKTSSHLPTQDEADRDRQLALYQIGLQGLWDDVEHVDLVWHYVRFDTELVSRRTGDQLEEVRVACIATIDDIESRGRDEGAFPTKPTRLCDWCDFSATCPATRHEVATRALDPEGLKQDDGVALVDAWADTRARRRTLLAEANALKEAEAEQESRLEEFAVRHGFEAVIGSTHRAEMKRVVELSYPLTGSDEREAFEAALKSTGLWDKVAIPSPQRLSSLLAKPGSISAESEAELAPFIERTERARASLRMRRDE